MDGAITITVHSNELWPEVATTFLEVYGSGLPVRHGGFCYRVTNRWFLGGTAYRFELTRVAESVCG
jgi:hypothetical protein